MSKHPTERLAETRGEFMGSLDEIALEGARNCLALVVTPPGTAALCVRIIRWPRAMDSRAGPGQVR